MIAHEEVDCSDARGRLWQTQSHPVSLQRGPRAELWGVESADASGHQLPDSLRVCPVQSHLPEVRLLLGAQLLLTGQGVGTGGDTEA